MPARDPRAALDPAELHERLSGVLSRVETVGLVGSTNDDLVAAVAADTAAWPDRSALVADHQVAGRGRAGRVWETPPGTSVTVSFLLRPGIDPGRYGWLGLLTGLASVRALGRLGVVAAAKWPNDVVVEVPDAAHVDGWGRLRKLGGVLGEVVGEGAPGAVVVGVGLNVGQSQDELPVPWAASLAAVGAAVSRADVIVALAEALVGLDDRWRASDGDPYRAGLAEEYLIASATLGRPVAVSLPGGGVVAGIAESVADTGALEVRDGSGELHVVHAGQVHHLRLGD